MASTSSISGNMPVSTTSDLVPLPLPPNFLTIEQIKGLPNEDIKTSKFINIIGFVKDYQPPIATRGSDFKCTLSILDPSTPYDSSGLRINIFWPEERMPVAGRKDALLVRNAKVQMFSGEISLISNKASEFNLLSWNDIPTSLGAAKTAPWRQYRYDSVGAGKPTETETRYVMSINDGTHDMDMPSDHEFEERAKQALNVKDKFRLLKDVRNGNFYDILCRVIKTWDYGMGNRFTVYASDYTENDNFRKYVYGEDNATGRDGDEYGYTNKKKKPENTWLGPFGKNTIQLTLWDGHADFARDHLTEGDWVLLSNVQIKFGKEGGCLEGFLRGDSNSSRTHRVEIMKPAEDPSQNDPRYKNAVRRRSDYEKKLKQEIQQLEKYAADLAHSVKREREDDEESSKNNSKKRRKAKRAKAFEDAAAMEARLALRRNLNENIRCNRPDTPITPLSRVLEPRLLEGTDVIAPYDYSCYKANVRVVDYFPPNIKDFSVAHRETEMDILSDYSGDEDTDPEEDMRAFRTGRGFGNKKWEWRFALQVEAADSKERMWLMVNNHDAQGLLNLEDDAANLRHRDNEGLLNKLKEQMFKLWGDLEEQKSAALLHASANHQGSQPTSSLDSFNSSQPPPTLGGQPDVDSDDDEAQLPPHGKHTGVLTERDPNIPTTTDNNATGAKAQGLAPKNKAFTCCIKAYAVKVDEEDAFEANAGEGKRWQRMFALCGTQIL